MIAPSLHAYLTISILLFAVGLLGVLVRRNALVVFMCLELMLVASTVALVAFSRYNGTMDGKLRRIEVRPKTTELKVRARKGYVASPLPPQQSIRIGG